MTYAFLKAGSCVRLTKGGIVIDILPKSPVNDGSTQSRIGTYLEDLQPPQSVGLQRAKLGHSFAELVVKL